MPVQYETHDFANQLISIWYECSGIGATAKLAFANNISTFKYFDPNTKIQVVRQVVGGLSSILLDLENCIRNNIVTHTGYWKYQSLESVMCILHQKYTQLGAWPARGRIIACNNSTGAQLIADGGSSFIVEYGNGHLDSAGNGLTLINKSELEDWVIV